MKVRSTRRAAERAARDLIKARALVVGDLGVVDADVGQLTAVLTAAQERGRQLVRAAEQEADRLVGAARAELDVASLRYAETHARAVAAGWQPGDLDALGFPSPGGHRPAPGADPIGQPHCRPAPAPRGAALSVVRSEDEATPIRGLPATAPAESAPGASVALATPDG